MQLGATFPQTEIGNDPGALRAYAQAVEDMGFDYILAYDHVLGADISKRSQWRPVRGGPPTYNHTHMFHEPLVLFGYLGAITKRIGFSVGILVLGQRQTALVAKQAAEVDILTGGRLRLGIGAGWNDVEFEALGMTFHDRGRRNDEQIQVLRALWTQETVDFTGRWHTITAAGINPLPIQRPIPIWVGGGREPVLRRAGRYADGVFLNVPLGDDWETITKVRSY
ncbi:LLM class F420-dependent oxidoreductase, partial [Dehalococcoidia bacterium]|nr:LLM class F420-dependent oxidoreductase [Dehalococcoidia bacterium]